MRTTLLCLLLLASFPAFAGDKEDFVGTWKLRSLVFEDMQTKERKPLFGEKPRGYQIATPEGRWIGLLTTENRPAPKTDADRLVAQRTMISYSGRYRLEKGKLISKLDASSEESWVGIEETLTIRFENRNTLHLESAPVKHPADGKKSMRIIATWERDKS